MSATFSASLVFPGVGQRRPPVPRRAGRTWRAATVCNGTAFKTTASQTWNAVNNKFFETFSYLPPLTDDQIAKQVENMVINGWTPCLEFATPDKATTDYSSPNSARMKKASPGYYDNRFWTMWKLPMFGVTDPYQVLREIDECRAQFPTAYIRLVAFDDLRQVQITSFIVHRPPSDPRSNVNPMWQQE